VLCGFTLGNRTMTAGCFFQFTGRAGMEENMLALSRKKNEAIVVNNNVEITILDIKGDQVKLGITAPREVPVYRKEVYTQIQEANKEAMTPENMDGLQNLLG